MTEKILDDKFHIFHTYLQLDGIIFLGCGCGQCYTSMVVFDARPTNHSARQVRICGDFSIGLNDAR